MAPWTPRFGPLGDGGASPVRAPLSKYRFFRSRNIWNIYIYIYGLYMDYICVLSGMYMGYMWNIPTMCFFFGVIYIYIYGLYIYIWLYLDGFNHILSGMYIQAPNM